MMLYCMSNVGKLFSYSTLQKISGIKSLSSVKNYLEYYNNSYLLFYLKKYDFVVKEGLKIVEAIQVCYDLNFENEKRELLGLIEAVKTYELKTGIILTMNQDKTIESKGYKIKLIPVWKWLINN